MKRFFMSFLGAMAAIWLSGLLISIGFVFILIAAAASGTDTAEISDNSVLHLKLEGEITDRPAPVDVFARIQGNDAPSMALNQIVAAITRAADDKQICGIAIEGLGSSSGAAQRMAIMQALEEFRKKSDKWIVAYADSWTQGDYILATAADSLWINPIGEVDIHGLSSTTMFFKNLMDKVGIDAQIVKVGTYKSAVEPFMLDHMSEPARRQQQLYLDNIWSTMAYAIAQGRNVPVDSVNAWADNFVFARPTDYYIDSHIVDAKLYRHEFDQKIKDLTGDDDPSFVTPEEYCSAHDINVEGKGKGAKIAVLYALGDITTDGDDGIASETLVPEILKLAEKKDIDGLIMHVNSGGGSAYASEQIWEALQQFKELSGKPFYVSMGDYAASGGYYISCGADKIYAQPQTLTGSIGIFGIIPNAKRLMSEHLGINTATVATNKGGDFPNLLQPMSASQQAAMQSYVDRGYALFTSRCANGRNMPLDSILAIAEGRVWDGSEAIKIGLVDKLGTLSDAISDMALELGAEGSYTIVEYPSVEFKWYDALLDATDQMKASVIRSELGAAAPAYQTLQRIKTMSTLQCHSGYIEIK